jgi:DNA-3-methyladenine glycosylase II
LSDEDAIKALVKLKGVGQWTAEMILIFSLGREDVWPCDDAGLLRVAKY